MPDYGLSHDFAAPFHARLPYHDRRYVRHLTRHAIARLPCIFAVSGIKTAAQLRGKQTSVSKAIGDLEGVLARHVEQVFDAYIARREV
jgi:hypothetical protein